MRNVSKRCLAAVIAAVMALSFAFAAPAINAKAADETEIADDFVTQAVEYITKAQAAEAIYNAAKKYRADVTKDEITRSIPAYGDGGGFATRLESLVMISAAFGELPAAKGDQLLINPTSANYEDVNDKTHAWANAAIANLNKGRILAPSADAERDDDNKYINSGNLKPDEEVDAKELNTLIARVYALYGTRPQDDFYAAINHDYLVTAKLPADKRYGASTGVFQELAKKVQNDVDNLITEITTGDWDTGTSERKAADYYASIVDTKAREAEGVSPIMPYIEAVENASTLAALGKAQELIVKETGFSPLFYFFLVEDYWDSSKYALQLVVPWEEDMFDETIDSPTMTEYRAAVANMFAASGSKNPEVVTKQAMTLAIDLAAASSKVKFKDNNVENAKRYTMAELEALFPTAGIKTILVATGYKEEDTYTVSAKADVVLKELARQYKTSNINNLKSYIKYALLKEFHNTLNAEMKDSIAAYEVNYALADYAHIAAMDDLSVYWDDAYAERYNPLEARRDVMTMVDGFIHYYRQRISAQDWLSNDTKAEALKKLDNIRVTIGGRDRADDTIELADIKTSAEGGGYFYNRTRLNLAEIAHNAKLQGTNTDPRTWDGLHTYEVNAFYSPELNRIVLPAAILQAPFYTFGAPLEQNLGGIGWVIAHEITHAFDVDGGKYDENGDLRDWWTQEDKEKFEALCDAVVDHYDGYEVAPGIAVIGVETLRENTADLGGIACAITMLYEEVKEPDFKMFFTSIAVLWAGTQSRDNLSSLTRYDEHAPAKARVNKTVQTFDEFYEAFSVKPGDGMYLSPEERVRIW